MSLCVLAVWTFTSFQCIWYPLFMNLKSILRTLKRVSPANAPPEVAETEHPGWEQSEQLPASYSSSPTSSRASPLPISRPFYPGGLKIWHDCPDATVDICFVHGLGGDRDATWTAKGQADPWPQTLLPDRLGTARILTFGYDSRLMRWSRGNTAVASGFHDHAAKLLEELHYNRESSGALSRPLVFVVHSMGGLLCKRAMLVSRNDPERHDIFNSTLGIIFMGTPHCGSWMAKLGHVLASELTFIKPTNRILLASLRTDRDLIRWIQDDFDNMLLDLYKSRPSFEVVCFYEELGMPIGGVVVSKESATLRGCPRYGIHANHRNMVRFASADDPGFQKVLRRLTHLVEISRTTAPLPQADGMTHSLSLSFHSWLTTCRLVL